MSATKTPYEVAVRQLDAMREYAAQVEDGARDGDLALLLAADAIVSTLFAIIDAMPPSPA